MQRQRAVSLRAAAVSAAELFSKDRAGNVLDEVFAVERIVVLGETTAAVVFLKQPTLKKAVAFFYFLNSRLRPRWEFFFITYAHLASLQQVGALLAEVEQHNFDRNFTGSPGGEPDTSYGATPPTEPPDDASRFGF